MFTGGFKQVFVTVPSSQLINPTALSREASGLISSKETSDEIFYVQKREEKGNKIITLEIPLLSGEVFVTDGEIQCSVMNI